jgi:hypothetical protein
MPYPHYNSSKNLWTPTDNPKWHDSLDCHTDHNRYYCCRMDHGDQWCCCEICYDPFGCDEAPKEPASL